MLLSEFRTAFSVYDRTGDGKISLKHVMELCRELGHNLTATDRDVIVTEFRLGGETCNAMLFMKRLEYVNTGMTSSTFAQLICLTLVHE